MYNSDIEKKLVTFLESAAYGTAAISDELIEEFGEHCKKIIKANLLDSRLNEPFRLRMSNIGKDLRQLHLEKEYGRSPLSPETKLKMTYGALTEALMLLLLKASNVQINEISGKCSLKISNTVVDGEFDIDVNDEIIDIKSASSYAYENKFSSFNALLENDSFGYIGQLVGYSEATGKKPGGWLVVDKVTGAFKYLKAELSGAEYQYQVKKLYNTVKHFEDNKPIPECQGVVDEVRYKKPTGNKILGSKCNYCDHKFKCHPNLKYLPDVNSTAKVPTNKYYVELKNKNV